jgi:hypothetical protein
MLMTLGIAQLRDYPGYSITPDGHVLGKSGKWLTWKQTKGGYLQVGLSYGGKQRWIGVHRLVALAWIGPPPTAIHQVAHWDGNPTNNQASNLRWATPEENAVDRDRHGHTVRGGRHHNRKKTHCPAGHPYTPENIKMDGGKRRCRTCSIARTRAWMDRNRRERKT